MSEVTLTQVTDPACTWCWGAEPVLGRLEETYREQLSFDYVMGGLVEDFETFHDAANDVTVPADVAPHWEAAAERHGMPVDPAIWRVDPPRSTYPASVAYEAAAMEDPAIADRYLRRLREAVATERRNIARRRVLVTLAEEVGLDVDAFRAAIDDGSARDAFREDRAFARRHGATAFPSYRVSAGGETRWCHGFQSFEELAAAVEAVAPSVPRHEPRPLEAFLRRRGRVATVEVAETYGMDHGKAMETLRSLAAAGTATVERRGTGYLWRLSDSGSDGSVDAADRGSEPEPTGAGDSTGRTCDPTAGCDPTDG